MQSSMHYLAVGTSALVGLVFLVSSVSKLIGRGSFPGFVASIRDMWILPAGLVRPVAVLVVVAELAVWMLLAVPVTAAAVAGHMVAIGLLAAFAAGVGSALRRGVRAACRCFGPSGTQFGIRHMVRNAFLVCVAAVGIVAWSRSGPASAEGLLIALAAGLLTGGLVTVLDDLIDLFRPTQVGVGRS